jgi:flagellar biosynthesis/type III secretory pathway protein FliH
MGDKNIKKAKEQLSNLSANPKLQELARMRENAARDWASMVKEATQVGIEIGVEKGIKVGVEKGRQEGMEKGRQEGVEKGKQLSQQEILKKILASSLGDKTSINELSNILGYSEEEILAAKKTLMP